ncbi:unnamed protein product [Pleuronectes platessa]|uniref:Uncharacterized protein n=1 Tax=Pleuronectes platessa TaxID=8262 RepID=A0A9N7YAT1_PLEPL|nr:unnamed protein product [Pleuronectes platessa]
MNEEEDEQILQGVNEKMRREDGEKEEIPSSGFSLKPLIAHRSPAPCTRALAQRDTDTARAAARVGRSEERGPHMWRGPLREDAWFPYVRFSSRYNRKNDEKITDVTSPSSLFFYTCVWRGHASGQPHAEFMRSRELWIL